MSDTASVSTVKWMETYIQPPPSRTHAVRSSPHKAELRPQVNQRSQAELNRVKAPEPESGPDPALFVDAELSAKGPRDRRARSTFAFVQAGRLQRQAEVQRLRVRARLFGARRKACGGMSVCSISVQSDGPMPSFGCLVFYASTCWMVAAAVLTDVLC